MPDNIQWIKISTGLFDDEKIKLIAKLPDADTIIIIWLYLLILAGKVNDGGLVYLGERLAYNAEELATVVDRPVNTVRLALVTFKKYQMIEETENGLYITNWEKHQNIDGMEKLKGQWRTASLKYREKHKQIQNGQLQLNASSDFEANHITSYDGHNTDKNRIDKNRIDKKMMIPTETPEKVKSDGIIDVIKVFEECGGTVASRMIADQLTDAEQEYGAEIVIAAFKKASNNSVNGARLLSYCQPIFEQYKTNGLPKRHMTENGQPRHMTENKQHNPKVEGVIIEE